MLQPNFLNIQKEKKNQLVHCVNWCNVNVIWGLMNAIWELVNAIWELVECTETQSRRTSEINDLLSVDYMGHKTKSMEQRLRIELTIQKNLLTIIPDRGTVAI